MKSAPRIATGMRCGPSASAFDRRDTEVFSCWPRNCSKQALPVAAEFTSPRAWAFTLIGIDEYLRRFSGDRRAHQIRESLAAKLMQRYADAAADEWEWFEEVVSYANAKLPHAMILTGRCTSNPAMLN